LGTLHYLIQKIMAKRGRGSAAQCYSDNDKVILPRSYDNKVVNLTSNYIIIGKEDKAYPIAMPKLQKYIEINRPEVVRLNTKTWAA